MNRLLKVALAALTLMMCVPLAAHASPQRPIQLTGYYGWRYGGTVTDYYYGTKYHIDASGCFGGILSLSARPNQWAEFTYGRQSSKVKVSKSYGYPTGEVKMALDNYLIGGVSEAASMNPNVHPIAGGMIGFTHFSSPDGKFTSFDKFTLGLDLGAKIMPNPKAGLRIDARGYATFVGGGGGFYAGSGGAGLTFSGTAIFQGDITAGLVLNF